MLGPGKYVFKDGSQQIGEYSLAKAEVNNNAGGQNGEETVKSGNEFVTKWKCKKRIPGNNSPQLIFAEDV